MSVLIISAVFPPEPVVSAKISYQLAIEMANIQSTIVLFPPPTRPNGKSFEVMDYSNEKFEATQVDSYTCPQSSFLGRMRESFSFGKATARYIDKNAKNIKRIYINTWPMFAQYKTIKAAERNNIPIIVHIQDIYPESMLPRLGFLGNIIGTSLRGIDAFYLKKASFVITISDKMKDFLIRTRGLKANRLEVVRNWQDESAFEHVERTSHNTLFTYMFVGSISPAAGVEFIISAFINARIENSKLIIAGDGSSKKDCQRLVAESCVNSVEFISVSPEEVPFVQEKADVLLLSLKKGVGETASPSKLPAYMFSAKPILASVDVNSDAEYVIHTANCGFVCKAEDEVEFVALLRKIIEIPEKDRIKMGQNGRNYALENMSKEKNLEKILKLVNL